MSDTTHSRPMPNRLRIWRTGKGLTLEEVSDLTGYSIAHLSRAERGEKNFSPEAKVLISRRLGVPIRELFDPEDIDLGAEAS